MPPGASRREVQAALDAAWRAAQPAGAAGAIRLLVCEQGVGIAVVALPHAAKARQAIGTAGSQGPVRLTPEVTSGTILTVKGRMGLATRRPRRA